MISSTIAAFEWSNIAALSRMPPACGFGHKAKAGRIARKAAGTTTHEGIVAAYCRGAARRGHNHNASPAKTVDPAKRPAVVRLKPAKVNNANANALNTPQPSAGASATQPGRVGARSRDSGSPTAMLTASSVSAHNTTCEIAGIVGNREQGAGWQTRD